MADTAARLVGPTQLSASAATVYTVPASTTTTLLHIIAVNTSSTVSATITLSIGADAANKRILDGRTIAAKQNYEWRGYLVMTAAEILQAYSDTASVITLSISGVTTV